MFSTAVVDLESQGIECRIVDIRWIAPLPVDGILAALNGVEKVLVVDECRGTGGQSEALVSLLSERTNLPHSRIAAEDSFIPTGPSYASTMPSRQSIVAAAKQLWDQK